MRRTLRLIKMNKGTHQVTAAPGQTGSATLV